MSKFRCDAKITPHEDENVNRVRHEHGIAQVRCQLPPGHHGNHYAKTKIAEFQWWNEEDNPQKETK